MPIGQTVAELWRFNGFQNGGHPPSWICCTRVWTSHEECLVAFIIVQNLIRIDTVVSIICKFLTHYDLDLKMSIHAPKMEFGGLDPPKWGAVSYRPLKVLPWAETRHMTYFASQSVDR